MTFSFMFIEVIVGYWSGSLALVADSFHMMSDVLSLLIGIWAVRLAKKQRTKYMTYGYTFIISLL